MAITPTQSHWAHAGRAYAKAMIEHDEALKRQDAIGANRVAQDIFTARERLLALHKAEQAELLRQGIG